MLIKPRSKMAKLNAPVLGAGVFLFLLLSVMSSVSSSEVLWSDENCNDGNVTDFVCCQDDHCGKVGSQKACDLDKTCLWSEDSCKVNRDSDNNVCCKAPVMAVCASIVKGECPEHFQVPSGCCSDSAMKYDQVLTVDQPGYVCCNNPCGQIESHGCSYPERCNKDSGDGPSGRSMFGGGYGGWGGGYVSPMALHQNNYGFNP